MGYIIKRQEAKEIGKERSWTLLYGRRKVGKTFLLRNLCKIDSYFLVKKDLNIFNDTKNLNLEEFKTELKTLLKKGKTVVVDEFQRLKEEELEEITPVHPKGKLIISGSSLRVVHKVFDPKSPLLGFFTPNRLGFITPSNIIKNLDKEFSPKKNIELSTFLREPWLIPQYNQEEILKFVYKVVSKSKYIITALIGEIFAEEDRELSERYETILSLIGSGIWDTKELTSLLYARKLIPDPSPHHVIQYIRNLEEMQLIEGIKMHRSKNKYHRLVSPIMNIFYYLDSRYDIINRDTTFEEVKPTLQRLVSLEIQNFIAELFTGLYNGRKEYFMSPEKEIDFIITRRNKTLIIGEVKWGKTKKENLKRFTESAKGFHGKKIIIIKEGKLTSRDINIMTPEDIIKLVKKFPA